MRHIIHKQTVTLEMPESKDSNLFQDKVSHLLRNDLNGAMETVFDRISADGEVIRIDKLRLDLGEITPDNFEAEFKSRLIDELTKALPKVRSEASGDVVILKPIESLMSTLQYFLQYGRLPWYAGSKHMHHWEAEILEKFGGAEWKVLVDWIKIELASNPAVIERVIWQFSDKFIITFLSQADFDREWVAASQLICDDLALVLKELSGTTTVRRFIVWKMLLEAAIENKPLVQVIEEAIGDAIKKNAPAAIRKALRKIDWASQLKTAFAKKMLTKISQDATFIAKLKKRASSEPESGNKKAEKTIPGEIGPKEKKEIKQNPENREAPEDEGDFIFVHNCGIVILTPFLKPYFAELELLDNKDFVDEDTQKRAVLLLHYLATGNSEVAEFDLTFQKLLCGLPLDEPLPNAVELNENEKAEAEELLRSVTRHWTPLNNTSIEGLQATFLQREGKMEQLESGWKLQVETKTVDILLDKLPWGYSTIILPWLGYTIHVEWY